MKALLPFRPRSDSRGSALVTVMFLATMLALLASSILSYTLSERRLNERNRLTLRAKNMSESISTYAAEQITTKLYRLRSASPIAFMTGSNQIYMPPTAVLQAADPTYTSGTNMEVRAGLTGSTGLQFIDPATYPNNPNAGLQVNTATVPIIAKATSRHGALGTITSYSEQDLAVDFVPLFQFAVFYNMDMEIWPGADMTIAGPVHCNGELSVRSAQGFTATISFLDRVSSSKGFYADANRQGAWINNSGSATTGAGGDAPVNLKHSTSGTTTAIKSGTGTWRDHKYGGATETTTTQNNFKVFATTTYGTNLRTSVHGVTPLVLPSVSNYKKTNDPSTTEDDRDNGRQVIEPADSTDTAGLKETKFSRRAGLYIIVNPDDTARTGHLPDGTTVSMRARSYRAWLNTVNADQSHTIYEVILPGQPSYGANNANVNNLPNAYRTDTSVGSNQVLRTIQGGGVDGASTGYSPDSDLSTAGEQAPSLSAFGDAYFYDLRRATNNTGAGALLSTGTTRSSANYTPRPIVKIDFDLARFRMAVTRTLSGTSLSYAATATTATVYDPNTPASGNWTNSIFNSAGVAGSRGLGLTSTAFTTLPTSTTLAAADPFRIYYAPANPADTAIATDPGRFAVGGSDLVSTSTAKPWFDGITVYIESVDAEVRALSSGSPVRIDSGVRLINARGPVISLDGTTYPSRTGFAFGTNDAAYLIGHFNADGSVNSTTTATGNGGYSARYPDSSSEMLCSIMADAITILSQPYFTSGTTPYTQTSGWCDALSANRTSSSGWTSSWASTQPSASNAIEGAATSLKPATMPFLGTTSAASAATAATVKLTPNTTEISSCLLVGIVPTNHDPTGLTDGPPSTSANGQASGGVHNFPRLLESWGTAGLYIRGSMVAMFESRVAMEPWNLRIYSAPARTWGLHENLRSASHDIPLEPILLGARRLGFREITATEYSTTKTTIEALPH